MPKAKPRMNAVTELTMSDGTVLKLTLTWGLLVKLRAKNKSLYKRFSSVITKGFVEDIVQALEIVYAGYICQYIDETGGTDDALTEDEFQAVAPNDIYEVIQAAQELIAPKAAAASRAHSQTAQNN